MTLNFSEVKAVITLTEMKSLKGTDENLPTPPN